MMKAHLIAYTVLNESNEKDPDRPERYRRTLQGLPYKLHDEPVTDADELAEFAGRACYESWERPNPATATNGGYVAHILDVGHFSVLEHAYATFYLEDVARSFTHELVRHRHMSYSQRSQRYVDESGADFVLPPGGDEWEAQQMLAHHEASLRLYERLVVHRLDNGQTRKQAREAGRAVLLQGTETRIVVSGNHRAWRELIQKRYATKEDGTPLADLAFHQNANTLLVLLKGLAPNTYQDL